MTAKASIAAGEHFKLYLFLYLLSKQLPLLLMFSKCQDKNVVTISVSGKTEGPKGCEGMHVAVSNKDMSTLND